MNGEAEVVDVDATTTLGWYAFPDLEAGRYRLAVNEIPDYYNFFSFGHRWDGLDDDGISNGGDDDANSDYNNDDNGNSNNLIVNGKPVDHATGRSPCLLLEEGEDQTVSFGVRLAVPGPRPLPFEQQLPDPLSSDAPSDAPSSEPSSGPSGSLRGSSVPSIAPSPPVDDAAKEPSSSIATEDEAVPQSVLDTSNNPPAQPASWGKKART